MQNTKTQKMELKRRYRPLTKKEEDARRAINGQIELKFDPNTPEPRPLEWYGTKSFFPDLPRRH